MVETRKEFLKKVMRLAGLQSIAQADRVAQVVIGLIKERIGPELSERVAEAVPADLAQGWRAIALPAEAMEVQEMMFEVEEVGEESRPPEETRAPEYG
jgi:uncharacterized protein (DUF2267 family)